VGEEEDSRTRYLGSNFAQLIANVFAQMAGVAEDGANDAIEGAAPPGSPPQIGGRRVFDNPDVLGVGGALNRRAGSIKISLLCKEKGKECLQRAAII
jgi:hypothetical protein